jgi:hypothetical protein
MSSTAHFQVDPRLATLLSETYRSSEQAIKELVDNAWDADAEQVWIDLPNPMTSDPVLVRDSGSGMTEEELRHEYLRVARDRRITKGERTTGKKRRVKGRRGIGKFAGLMVADAMRVETSARGRVTVLTIPRNELVAAAADLEGFELPISSLSCGKEEHGTRVTLSDLHQKLSFPDAEKLKQLLVVEYGRETDFAIFVNGQRLTIKDIPGEEFQYDARLPEVGHVKLIFKISDGKHQLKHSGIAIRVGGKVVGRPTWFGLENAEDVPKGVLRRLYGEVDADGLLTDVTADWAAIIENSKAYAALESYVQPILKRHLETTFKREFAQTKARIQQEIDRRLAKLPEYRREYARKAIEKVMIRFYEERDERIAPIVSVMLDALERDEYWYVIREIEKARNSDVRTFAESLSTFGLAEMALISRQAQSRLFFLDELDRLMQNPKTREQEIHTALERNLWVFGSDFALLTSNETLARTVQTYSGKAFTGTRAKMRPDLLLLRGLDGRHVLIEFKRPSHQLSRDDQNQAEKYRDDLAGTFNGIDILLLGGSFNPVLPNTAPKDVRFMSYPNVVSRARQELTWLLEGLAKHQVPTKTAVGPS